MEEEYGPWVPILRVKDARAGAAFYEKALGFQIDWEHRFEEGFPLYAQVSLGQLTLHLSEHEGGGTQSADLFLRVSDVDAAHRRMTESGITPESEPTDQPYGLRDFAVVDLDGHRITLGTPTTYPTEDHRPPEQTDG